MKGLTSLVLGLGIALTGPVWAVAEEAPKEAELVDLDPRIAENPAIAALHADDPVAALAILEAIDAINEANANKLPKGNTRSTDSPPPLEADEQAVIDQNPAFQELYARDREATLKLIKLVIGE